MLTLMRPVALLRSNVLGGARSAPRRLRAIPPEGSGRFNG